MRPYVCLLASAALAQTEYRGKIESELAVPANRTSVVRTEDKVFEGNVRGALAYVVETHNGETALYVDVNGDQRITADEKRTLGPASERLHAGIAVVEFPLSPVSSQDLRVQTAEIG